MPDGGTFLVFCTAAVVLLVIPGPAVVFIVARSAEHGRAVGVASALGVATGTMGHACAAAFGLSAILVQSAAAFTVVKVVGGAYLVWIGVRRLLRPPPAAAADDESEAAASLGARRRRVGPATAFRQGVVVNLLNPKVALFFLAFLPQFVDAERGSALVQTLALGTTFAVLGIMTDGTYAVVAGSLGELARRRLRRRAAGSRAVGLVYIALGISAIFTRRGPASAGAA